MNMRAVLDYLADLEAHNDREWFHANRARYQAATGEFEALVSELNHLLCRCDESIPLLQPRELTFKLMRDTRFSHDKSPYLPAFRAHIAPKGKLPIPVGYYLMIRPGGRSFLGGGLFADMFRDATEMVRGYLTDHGEEWREILAEPSFAERFTVGGTALKQVPRGYDAGHPQAEFLKNKSWYLEYPVTDAQVTDADFVPFAGEIFARMQPFNRYLNQALSGFEMPTR